MPYELMALNAVMMGWLSNCAQHAISGISGITGITGINIS